MAKDDDGMVELQEADDEELAEMDALYNEIDDEDLDEEEQPFVSAEEDDAEEDDDDQALDPEDQDTKDDDDQEEEETPAEAQRRKSWEGRLKKREQELNEREAAMRQERAPAAGSEDTQTKAVEDAKPTQAEINQMTDEELEEFEAEYPDVQRYMDTRTHKVEQKFTEQVAPIVQDKRQAALDNHFNTLRSAHPDFQDLAGSDDMDAFINEAPAYARDGMRRVLASGTADECIELLDDYKQARDIEIVREKPSKKSDDAPRQRGRKREEAPIKRGSRNVKPSRRASGSWDELYDNISDDSIE